jgi:hypothetical protein
MRRKRNKASQLSFCAIPQVYPLEWLVKLKQPSGSPNGAKFVQILIMIIMIDERLAAL